jgi:hypothetical protein
MAAARRVRAEREGLLYPGGWTGVKWLNRLRRKAASQRTPGCTLAGSGRVMGADQDQRWRVTSPVARETSSTDESSLLSLGYQTGRLFRTDSGATAPITLWRK